MKEVKRGQKKKTASSAHALNNRVDLVATKPKLILLRTCEAGGEG